MRLIDADALCMHLSDWQFGSMTDGKHDAEYEVINKVIDGIEQQPTVDAVERKRGRWLELTNTNHTYVCSVCGRMLVNITDGKNNVAKNYPYCHCGADMRGETDEHDQ